MKPETMMIDDVKYIREDSIPKPEPVVITGESAPWQIGKIYFIRTVTMIITGILQSVHPQELVLTEAAWIASTGRFAQALQKAEFDEVEPFPEGMVIVGRGSVIDAVTITKKQRTQK